jgi:hypothetical protein
MHGYHIRSIIFNNSKNLQLFEPVYQNKLGFDYYRRWSKLAQTIGSTTARLGMAFENGTVH